MANEVPHDAEAVVTYLRPEDGGRSRPISSNYRPQFHYDGRDWDAFDIYPDAESVAPGETARVFLSFLSPESHEGKLRVGTPFLLREGRTIVGYGAITKLLAL
jgi:translation elongation factor EF-Tu-like GTPase